MEKEFVPPTEALELKELGFDKDSFRYYNNDFKLSRLGLFYKDDWMANAVSELKSDFLCLAPTYSQAFEFFREQQDWSIDSWIQPHLSQNPKQYEGVYWRRGETVSIGIFPTYKDAELACLRKLIDICRKIN